MDKGKYTLLGNGDYSVIWNQLIEAKVSGTSIKVWFDGNLLVNATDGTHSAGQVAFGGEKPTFDNLKIGYDVNDDDDIDDVGDDLVINTDFSSTSTTFAHDHAGNLVDDGTFIYEYDP